MNNASNNLADIVSWIATIATIVAATMTAANLGSRITGYGFCVFLAGSLAWLASGLMTGQPAIIWTNAALTLLNTFGIWRWLGRQAGVEEGARAASQASEQTPGEALFPVSLLMRAPLLCGGKQVGRCVDAMAGCASGRLSYVVVSQGGVGGVGETLRRLPWEHAQTEGETVTSDLPLSQFNRLEELARDQWPAR